MRDPAVARGGYDRAVPDLSEIRCALARHRAVLLPDGDFARAAVAAVLRPAARGPELLFIERARHPGDPWSGHMAFPGGRMDPDDPSLRHTAERETLEEVGLDLSGAEVIGQLDDLEGRRQGRPAGMVVSAFVYEGSGDPALVCNEEVQEALWVPVRDLADPARHVPYVTPYLDHTFPGIRVSSAEAHVVWGLTYRFVELLLGIIGTPIPDRWTGAPPGEVR
jgi:8-oxo-dGTP pyrophosphatase MutT (NUDIX family)